MTRTTESEPHADDSEARVEGRASVVHGGTSTGLPVAGPRPLASGYTRNGAPVHEQEFATEAIEHTEDVEGIEREGGAEALATHDAIGEEPVPVTAILESLLFVSGEALEASQLARAVGLSTARVRVGLAQLAAEYRQGGRGLRLQVHNDRYQLVTTPAAAAYVEGFLEMEPAARLSTAALETLAVIAYRQPVTRAQIEAVRGVDCAGVLRSLTVRGLIEETGRLEAVGRPILYAVTEHFMQHFGLMELGELPPLPEVDADLLHATTALAGAEAELLPGDPAGHGDGPVEVSEVSESASGS